MRPNQRKAVIACVSLAILLILGALAMAAPTIEGPKEIRTGQLVQYKIAGVDVAQAKSLDFVYYPRDGVTCLPFKTWDDELVVCFQVQKAGKYLLHVAKGAEIEVSAGGDTPNPPPPPPSPDNPWQPAAEWKPAVQPLLKFKVQKPDAEGLAKVYGNLSNELGPSGGPGLNTNGDLRAEIVRRGTALSIKGKYAGLAEGVEGVLSSALGLENVPLDKPRAAALLRTMAWAVWETGK